MKQYALALDLKEDPELIAEYEAYHRDVWPEIKESIEASGIQDMKIYRTGNRLFMIVATDDDFSFEEKARMDEANERVQEWEELMWKFQKPLPWAPKGAKWQVMDTIFEL